MPGIDFVQNTVGGAYLFHALCQSLEWSTVGEGGSWETPEEEGRGGGSCCSDCKSLLRYRKRARTVVFIFIGKKKIHAVERVP